MITLVIYGVIAIALAASAGYAFLTFSSSSRQLTQLQENQVRMETATAAIRASLLSLTANGVLYAPMGGTANGVAYTTLPTSLLGVVGAAPWGQPYEYCPLSQTTAFAPGTTSTPNITDVNGNATYQVGVYNNATATQNTDYVVTSPQTAIPNVPNGPGTPGYVAFIVSTLGPGQPMPSCAQITAGNNGVSVPGGTVRGVTAGFSYMQRVVASTDRMEIYVSQNGSGTPTGVDANNTAKLQYALNLWAALKPRLAIIYLETSAATDPAFNFDPLDAAGMDMQGQNASLVIESDPSSAAQATIQLTNAAITLPVATTFQNVTVNDTAGGNITAYKPLTFVNATLNAPGGLPSINVYGTSLTVSNSSLQANVYGSNASLNFRNYGTSGTNFGLNGVGLLEANNSQVVFEGPGANMNSQFATGQISLFNSSMTVGTSADLLNPNIRTNNATALTVNGLLTMNASHLTVNSGHFLTVTGQFNSNDVVAYGSTIDVEGMLQTATTGYQDGTELIGSTIVVNGTVKHTGSGSQAAPGSAHAAAGGALGAFQAVVVGGTSGFINTTGGTNSPCVNILRGSFNVANGQAYALEATKTNAPYGLPNLSAVENNFGYPLLQSYTATGIPTTGANANMANNLIPGTQAAAPAAQVLPLTIDPYVTLPNYATAPLLQGNYYLDTTSFEAAVRDIVNQEAVTGLNIGYLGGCSNN